MAKIKLIPALAKAAASSAEFALETVWSKRGAKNGIASLDANGKVPAEQLPDAVPIYEEGTWTPVVKPYNNSDVSNVLQPSYLAKENTYVRIGNVVKITFAVYFNGPPPQFQIDKNSLPFTVGAKNSDTFINVRADGLDTQHTVSYDGIRCLNHVKYPKTLAYMKMYGSGLDNFANELVIFSTEYRIAE